MISAKELLAARYNSDSLFDGSGHVFYKSPGMDYSSFKTNCMLSFPVFPKKIRFEHTALIP